MEILGNQMLNLLSVVSSTGHMGVGSGNHINNAALTYVQYIYAIHIRMHIYCVISQVVLLDEK